MKGNQLNPKKRNQSAQAPEPSFKRNVTYGLGQVLLVLLENKQYEVAAFAAR